MKYAVRYEVQGFVEKEIFEDKKSAEKYFNKILKQFGEWLLELEMFIIK